MHGLVLLVAVLAGVAEANPEKTFILRSGVGVCVSSRYEDEMVLWG